jgi:hypothetical protein
MRGEFVVECVVIVVFCVVIFESLKTRQLFELCFLAFPFWESDNEKNPYSKG